MAQYLCVAPGEMGEYGRGEADWLVGVKNQDHVYFYHVDSCVAITLVPRAPLDGHVLIGVHLGVFSPTSEIMTGTGGCDTVIKALTERYRDVVGQFTHAIYVGGLIDWDAFYRELNRRLRIPNSIFVNAPSADAFAAESALKKRVVHVLKWGREKREWASVTAPMIEKTVFAEDVVGHMRHVDMADSPDHQHGRHFVDGRGIA